MTSLNKNLINCKKGMRKVSCLVFMLLLMLFTADMAWAQQAYDPESGRAAYIAEINALNSKLTEGDVLGSASFIVADGKLYITIIAKGLPPSMMHLQHIHGFKATNKAAACPDPDADTNGDSIVDLIETHPFSGVTQVPFNGAPTELKIKSSSYPVANKNGLLTYQMQVPLNELKSAVKDAYEINDFSLKNYVLYIHGVPEDTSLPKTVKSLPGVPADVTVPIACGEIKKL